MTIAYVMESLFRMNENMEFPGISGEDIEWLQDSFVKAIKVIRNTLRRLVDTRPH